MMIRRYVGADEKAVIDRVRADLGPDAVILHTAYVRDRRWMGLLRRRMIEVMAGRGFRIVKDYPGGGSVNDRATVAPVAGRVSPEALQKEMAEIKRLVSETQDLVSRKAGPEGPPELAEEYSALAASRVSESLACKMVQQIRKKLAPADLRDRARIRSAMRDILKDRIRCVNGIALHPGRCVRVAFVGPTGVGKTTTIAKLLSIYAYRGKQVAVVANDTYRIAAAEQIRRVAQIVGVPVRVCPGPEEVAKAVEEFSNRDLVLVDTAGRNQKDAFRMDELKSVLAAARPDETHLVVSMTANADTLADVVERFMPCGYDRVVLTKLDEALKVGMLLDVVARVQKDLSFVTTGQAIPRNIEVADPERLASLILGEEAV